MGASRRPRILAGMHSGEVLLLVSIFDRRRVAFVTEVVNSDIEVEARLVHISGKSPSHSHPRLAGEESDQRISFA